jgi:membrane associated rhomboid family serine protease
MKALRIPATIVAAVGNILILFSFGLNFNDDLGSHEQAQRFGLTGLALIAGAAIALYKAGER